MVYRINILYTMIRMTQLMPFTADEKWALLALPNLSGFGVVDMVIELFLLRISADCVANNVIFWCILKIARINNRAR